MIIKYRIIVKQRWSVVSVANYTVWIVLPVLEPAYAGLYSKGFSLKQLRSSSCTERTVSFDIF